MFFLLMKFPLLSLIPFLIDTSLKTDEELTFLRKNLISIDVNTRTKERIYHVFSRRIMGNEDDMKHVEISHDHDKKCEFCDFFAFKLHANEENVPAVIHNAFLQGDKICHKCVFIESNNTADSAFEITHKPTDECRICASFSENLEKPQIIEASYKELLYPMNEIVKHNDEQ